MIATKFQRLDGVRVLVVDDNRDARELVTLMVKNAGATVQDAGHADHACAIVQRWKPDIIVSDLHMPDQDGYAFMKRIRGLSKEEGGQIPAIAITGHGPVDRLMAFRSGFQNYIRKPINKEELLLTIASLTVGTQGES